MQLQRSAKNDKGGILSFARWCSCIVSVWWKHDKSYVANFLLTSKDERILKIGQHLQKL